MIESKKKHVLNIFTSLDFGGVESHAIMLAKGSNYSAFNHVYLAISIGGDVADKLKKNGKDVTILNSRTQIPSLSTIYKIYSLIKKTKPDIVHTRGAEATFHGIIAATLAGTKIKVAEEIGIPTHSSLAKAIFKLTYMLADKVVAISKSVKEWVVVNGEAPAAKVQVIYNPTDFFPVVENKYYHSNTFKIGFIGRLEAVKNPLALVEAVKILTARGLSVKLELVGEGSQKKSILDFISINALQNLITVHGFLSEPHKVVQNCDLYVQPSITEGFGIAVVEVMGSGIPVLASSVGGIPEFIENNYNGWLLKSTDSESIADSIQMIMTQKNEERELVAFRGRESVINRFTIDAYISNLHELYLSIINEKS